MYANLVVKATKSYSNCADFCQFRRQLFHASLATIFSSLKPGTQPEVAKFPDGHFWRIIWGIGPYDYPEQVLLSCIVQGWCAQYVTFPSLDSTMYQLCLPRCRAASNQLDNSEDIYERRSRDHTDFLATKCEMGVLYDNYGIIGDIIASIVIYSTAFEFSDLGF